MWTRKVGLVVLDGLLEGHRGDEAQGAVERFPEPHGARPTSLVIMQDLFKLRCPESPEGWTPMPERTASE